MSNYSMKNSRKIAKERTRLLILDKTKELIELYGIQNITTKQISDSCQLAHGTIFSHFSNREELISNVIKQELIRIAKELNKLEELNVSFMKLLDKYLSLVARDEDLLVVLTIEYPFLSDSLQREIITTESIVKKLFYQRIEQGIAGNEYKAFNISVLLSFLFGTIHYYLARKNLFVSSGSVIERKKKDIINIFLSTIKL